MLPKGLAASAVQTAAAAAAAAACAAATARVDSNTHAGQGGGVTAPGANIFNSTKQLWLLGTSSGCHTLFVAALIAQDDKQVTLHCTATDAGGLHIVIRSAS